MCATYGNDDIDIVVGSKLLQDLIGKGLTHGQTALVDRDAVHDGIGTREVDVLKDTGGEAGIGNQLASGHVSVLVDNDGLTGLEILKVGEAATIANNTLRGKHVVRALGGLTLGKANGTNTIRVTETDDSKSYISSPDNVLLALVQLHAKLLSSACSLLFCLTSNHGNTSVTAVADIKDTLDGGEDILLVDTELASLLQVVGKDVKEKLRIGISVAVAMSILIQELAQLIGVDKISVLLNVNPEREERR